MRRSLPPSAGIFLLSTALLMGEVLALRQWKVALGFGAAFIVIPVVMMGISLGAVLAFFHREARDPGRAIGNYSLAYALSAPVPFLLLARASGQGFGTPMVLAAGFGVLNAVFWGAAIALWFRRAKGEVSRLYAIDLLGSATGAVVAMGALDALGSPMAISLFAALAICAGAVVCSARSRLFSGGLALLFAAAALFVLPEQVIATRLVAPPSWFGTNALSQVEAYPVRLKKIVRDAGETGGWTEVRDRLSAYALSTDERASPTRVIRYTDIQDLSFLTQDISSLPFAATPPGRAAVLGSGGGVELIAGLLLGWQDITAVELNPLIIEATRDLSSPGIYEDPSVTVHVGEARRFLAQQEAPFDLIFLPNVKGYGGVGGGGSGFVQNHLLTREAIGLAISRLGDRGVLAIRDHNWVMDVHRATLRQAWVDSGRPAQGHLLEFVGQKYSLLLARVDTFPPEVLARLQEATVETGFTFQPMADVDVPASTDDRPYAYNFRAGRFLSQGDEEQHRGSFFNKDPMDLVYGLLGKLLLGLTLFGLVLVSVPFWALRKQRVAGLGRLALGFVGLGAGFVIAELVLMDKLTVLLGHPTLSATVTLAALLVSAGLGSARTRDISIDRAAAVASRAAALSAVLLALTLLVAERLPAVPAPVGGALLLPAGFAMGMVFPLGLRLATEAEERSVPWMWAINGVAAVVGGLTARLLSIALGFRATMALAVLAYLLAAWMFSGLNRKA